MNSPVVELPVRQEDGCILLSFEPGTEDDLAQLDPAIPLTASLVVLCFGQSCLMVLNRFHHGWELPGGMIEPGESARDAAFRELAEESSQRPAALEFAGTAQTWYAPAQQRERLAIYRGHIDAPAPFTPNDEMSASTWWNLDEPLPDLLPIDAALARLVCATRAV